jgi:hypothetical protein
MPLLSLLLKTNAAKLSGTLGEGGLTEKYLLSIRAIR